MTIRQNTIVTENQLMSESVPTRKFQKNDIVDMQEVKGKGEMYFKQKLKSTAVPQNPGGKEKRNVSIDEVKADEKFQ